jgi:hypothetical protein
MRKGCNDYQTLIFFKYLLIIIIIIIIIIITTTTTTTTTTTGLAAPHIIRLLIRFQFLQKKPTEGRCV